MDEMRLRKILKINHELGKMLASRTYSEYAHAEAQVAKANHEQKPGPSYGEAWDSEDTING